MELEGKQFVVELQWELLNYRKLQLRIPVDSNNLIDHNSLRNMYKHHLLDTSLLHKK